MTKLPPSEFTLRVLAGPTELTVRLAGELDYDTSDDLIETVLEQLAAHSELLDVRLDFTDLTWIDSTGLSVLLMIHRRTSAAGVRLHLDHRPDVLERMLRITNVLDHLTAPVACCAAPAFESDDGDGSEAEVDGATGAGAT
ncbi:STAS domain-containing protein [Streptomyces mangrovisoli]|uniref:Anti-sigma factor antagonist n=1 Tax=Streptomyces mangrovisoli TaxID=1428628 RepID=A0A1J4P1K1_9ACTN|nr:STAS domain-containing protein [Streptomyces mangrovisoli]OIJ68098.1 hypothetical protein WN71_009900 [Streptomyces mangrovisoli]